MSAPRDPAQPSVGVVVPTHDRPELVREAIRSVLAQDVDVPLQVVVVVDRNTPDRTLEELGTATRPVRVLTNDRTPGLAGSRNTGILALDTDWVAFCDDDDAWEPGKLAAQLDRARAHPEADVVTTAIRVVYDGTEVVRTADRDEVTHEDLLRSRMAMLHSSTLLLRRSALLGELGLVDEGIPGSQNEDWDLLLRASDRAPVQHVDEPLVRVRWGRASYFSRKWQLHVDSMEWMLERHPDIRIDGPGAARVFGQLAFGYAALGRRGEAARWAGRSLRRNPREARAVLALAVASRVVRPETVLSALNRRGRGL
jgi:glycosyltransferase involved in cell wall biosynthesis